MSKYFTYPLIVLKQKRQMVTSVANMSKEKRRWKMSANIRFVIPAYFEIQESLAKEEKLADKSAIVRTPIYQSI